MAEYLRNNARDFFYEGERLLKEGKYNLAIFNLEQALQLAVKYTLFQLTGSFPKTHEVTHLLSIVASLTNNETLRDILNNERLSWML